MRKCPYCDFNSHPLRGDLEEGRYLDALFVDWQTQAVQQPVSTVFLGGGTPSLFSPHVFEKLLHVLAPEGEVTLEANPGTTEHADFASYNQAGINRVSLGAQSFDDSQLRALGRIHAARETLQAVANVRNGGIENLNLDLMYGLPDQTVDAAMADLEQAIALEPEHVSWYQLTLEPKTEFYRRPPPLPSPEVIAEMETEGRARLHDAGFRRYEVSAYAKKGYQCAHNLNYWRFGDYVGIGAGAHGKQTRDGNQIRTSKASQPRLYLGAPEATERIPIEREELAIEFLMNALRLVDGVSTERFVAATGLASEALEPTLTELVQDGLIDADRLRATPRGFALLDTVLARFL